MSAVYLCYLVHHEDAEKHAATFVHAYERYLTDAHTHDLVVLTRTMGVPEPLRHLADEEVCVEPGGFGLGAYARSFPRLPTGQADDVVIFCNPYSRPTDPLWVEVLAREARIHGMVGVTGSLESPALFSYDAFLNYPWFPNPHVRGNAFALRRDAAEIVLSNVSITTKDEEVQYECGYDSFTRRAEIAGFRPSVVGRAGGGYASTPVRFARQAGTFRSGGQENLLVACNRTDDYMFATGMYKEWLETLAWGRRGSYRDWLDKLRWEEHKKKAEAAVLETPAGEPVGEKEWR